MAKVPNEVEILPKISIAWVGCRNVSADRQTDDRQTDGRTTTYSEREREFTFAKKWSAVCLQFDCRYVDVRVVLQLIETSS